MAAALVLPVSGPYTSTWFAKPLGVQGDDGYELACTVQGQEVNETDAYGMTLVEGIYRGQNWRLRNRGQEWNRAGLLDSLQMFGQQGGTGTFSPILTNIGDRWSKFCQALVLTATLANPPTTPQSITATNAGIAPNSQTAFNLTSKLREMPLEWILIPYQTVIASVTYSVPFTAI
jgi:hypothetical protein